MTKRRIGRKKKPAGSRKPDLEKNVLEMLGEPEAGFLVKETLAGSSRARLLSASRLLGLTGISRLRKDDLVDCLWRALHGGIDAGAKEKAPRTTPEGQPPTMEHAVRSRAEFEAHKYSLTDGDLSATGPREGSAPKYIPWSYGRDRVRALAIDPERLYVYWEVADEARERARARLGAGASAAWLNLRVYDTTGRLFDGTNARSYFDHRVENGSRQWFFDIGKAGSEAFVEIGMKSHEGYFVRIARSGRVGFPRRSPAPYRAPQWLTVRAGSEAPAIAQRGVGQAFETAPRRGAPQPASVPPKEPPGIEPPVSETYGGEVSTFEVDGRTHVVFGPWQVVVRGLGAVENPRILSRWMVYRSWVVESGSELPLGAEGERHTLMLGSSALIGGSERRLRGASERRLGGASERIHGAASERLLRGASGRR